jgi:hypothetical protein
MTMTRKGIIGLLITEVISILDAEKDISIYIRESIRSVRITFTVNRGEKRYQLSREIDYEDMLSLVEPESYVTHVANFIASELTSAVKKDYR